MRSARFPLRSLVLFPVLLLCVPGLAAPGHSRRQELSTEQARPPAADVAVALQQRYDRIRNFSASFTQTYEGGVLRSKAVERGTVYISKPGRMRWDYTSPQRKLFVSDGKTMFMYFPEDKQVLTHPVPEEDEATSAALFLMGRGDVARDFRVQHVDGGGEDEYVLRLDPVKRQAEYDWLQVNLDRRTLQIRGLTAGDAQGGRSTFTFSNFKENAGLADKMFQFSIPRGTEVISSGKTP